LERYQVERFSVSTLQLDNHERNETLKALSRL